VEKMTLLELAQKRYSVRKYETKKVEDEKLAKILEAGRVAPTAHNLQPQKMIVVREPAGLAKLGKGGNVYGAPLAIIVCGDRSTGWVRSYDGKSFIDVDATIVTDHMMLQATELGLGTVWVCNFDPKVISAEFNLPDNIVPVNILAVGYAAGEAKAIDRHDQARKALTDTVSYE